MGTCFEVILRMSLTASFVIAAVFLVRLLLAYAPKRYSYVLWLVVLIRLLCPVAPESRFGVVPDMARILEESQSVGGQMPDEQERVAGSSAGAVRVSGGEVRSGAGVSDMQWEAGTSTVTGIPTNDADKTGALQGAVYHAAAADEKPDSGQRSWWVSEATWNVVGLCWLCGGLMFLGYGISGYLRLGYRLHRKEKQLLCMETDAVEKRTGKPMRLRCRNIRILEDSGIGAPFTAGIFRPVICLPKGLLPFQREMVLIHESVHIRRWDNLLKLVAYAVRCMHWFNPLVWLAFRYFEEDMEASCDEAVLRYIGYERRKEYAKTLLALSECQKRYTGFSPVSFGEKNAKGRIRHVLSAKKTSLWIILGAAVLAAVAAVVLLTDHKPTATVRQPADEQTSDIQNEQETADNRTVSDTEEANSAGSQGESGTREEYENRMSELNRQEEMQEELRQQQEEAMAQWEERLAEEQELLDELGAEVRTTELLLSASERVVNGTLPEGEIRLGNSEGYLSYTDRAVPVVHLDGVCALLCNPKVRFGDTGVAVEYSFPLEGIADGSVEMAAVYGCREHPVSGEISFHSGVDYAAEEGTSVYAAADACVYRTGFDAENGNYVILIHANSEVTYYAHCEEIEVQEGDLVRRGQQIATVGNTGKSTGAHLHFALSRQGAFVIPVLTDTLSEDSLIVFPIEG